MAIHLLPRKVLCRTPLVPLARHRDVVTTQGIVRGYYIPHPPHYAFLGIPYARPPTRYDRFKAPEPALQWDGIFEATHRIKCPQPDGTGDENCLVVNVFVPEHTSSLPVLVYFHGGGFQKGWGLYNVPVRFIHQEIIFVSFNYRLGALGFLSLGTPDIPGNAGLKDQVAALYWVQRNIAKFGGNPLETTVYGTGAGAASIELLVLSDIARNLFQRAILENGSALSPSSKSHDAQIVAFNFALLLGYKGDNNMNNLQEFYYKVPKHQLTNISRIFLPCIENASEHKLIEKDPWAVIQEGDYDHISMIIVYTIAEEAATILEDTSRYQTPVDFQNLLPNNLEIDSANNRNVIAKFIKDFYFGDDEMADTAMQNYIDYVNDVFLQFPTVKSAVYHSFKSNKLIFLMNFSNEGSSRRKSESTKKARHEDIMRYFTNENFDQNDKLISEILTTLWFNFIKLGDPTPLTTSLITTVWQPIVPWTINDKPVLRYVPCLKFSQKIYNTELNSPQLMFWDQVYDKFYKS